MRKRIVGDEKGFTLIEIIAVLIVLGILAAVAVPKYLDLADVAKARAAQGAIAEMQARASLAYAKYLLVNSGSQPTIGSIEASVNTDVGPDFALSFVAGTTQITISVTSFQGASIGTTVTGKWTMPTT